MSVTLREPPSTEDEIRARAEDLADEVTEQLAELTADAGPGPCDDDERVAGRERFYRLARSGARSLAASPAWHAHDLTTELLLALERLRDELDADPDGADADWRVREVLQRMLVVLRAMVRQVRHAELDHPGAAARYVATALAELSDAEVAGLLGISGRMVTSYRAGTVGQIRKNPARVTLVGQLVYELRGSMTARGILMWFDARFVQLHGRTPRELLDEDPATHRPMLVALARGGRGQLDQGGTAYGAVVGTA